jgi:hypothetical protein
MGSCSTWLDLLEVEGSIGWGIIKGFVTLLGCRIVSTLHLLNILNASDGYPDRLINLKDSGHDMHRLKYRQNPEKHLPGVAHIHVFSLRRLVFIGRGVQSGDGNITTPCISIGSHPIFY